MGANNSEKIDQFIDTTATTKQYDTFASQVDALDAKFLELTKTIKAFNDAAKDAKGFADFNKNITGTVTATEKLIQIQGQSQIITAKLAQEQAKLAIAQDKVTISNNNVTLSNNRVQASQDKAAESAKKALSPYQQLSKELDRQRLAAKDLGVQYGLNDPRFKAAQESVLKLDTQLKTLDKSLGQNQRNVGNYKDDIKSALNDLYGELNRLIPGAGTLTRTIVQGFQNIPRAANDARNAITSVFTPGGFGFKPNAGANDGAAENTAATAANTEVVNANTTANTANAASETERAAATTKSTEVETESTVAAEEGTAATVGLGSVLGTFTTVAFVAAIGAATYYLSQFKSTANSVSTFFAGIKNVVASFGEDIVEGFKGFKFSDLFKNSEFDYTGQGYAATAKAQGKSIAQAFEEGKSSQQAIIDLQNKTEIANNDVAQKQAASAQARARSQDRLLDITERQKALKEAQGLEAQVLATQKTNADLTINTAIQLGKRLSNLNDDQVKRLQGGDLKYAQDLANKGQQFNSQAYDVYKQGIEKRIALQQSTAAEQIRLQADSDNMQLRADRALAQAQERLDKARIEGVKDRDELILNGEKTNYTARAAANADFVAQSIKLIEIEKKNQLEAAGLGSSRGGKDSRTEAVNRAAIEQEALNKVNAVRAQGLKTAQEIQKDINEANIKEQKRVFDAEKAGEKALEDIYTNAGNDRLLQLDKNYSDQAALLTKQYADGEIKAEEYNSSILKLDQQTALQRIQIQIDTAKNILAAQSAAAALGFGDPKAIQQTANNLVKLQIDQSNLLTKTQIDNIHKVEDAKKENAALEKDLQSESISLIKDLIDNGYQNQIKALQDQAAQLDNNANLEKDQVENSLSSSQQKQREDKIIDAQTLANKQLLSDKQKQIQEKEALTNKAISIFNIGLTTAESVAKIEAAIAVAEAQATLYLSNPLTAAFYPAVAALIAAQELQVGLVIASGLAQIAVVAGTTPKYKYGTKNHPGGLGIVGDAGPELVKYPNGLTFLSDDRPTLLDMPKGTTVVPHLDTLKELQKINYAGGQSLDIREVAALLKENNKYQKRIAEKPTAGGNNMRGLANEIVNAQRLTDRRNSYFK